jgi:tricorn protease
VVAYAATYEGPGEVYTLPIEGGTPARQTWDAIRPAWLSWTPKGEVLYATRRHSTLPNAQLVRLDPSTHARTMVALAQASDGSFDAAGASLFFTRRRSRAGSSRPRATSWPATATRASCPTASRS